MNDNNELQYELDATHEAYVQLMQSRLNWCVQTERYEMAARLRDLIEYETTQNEDIKNKYYLHLLQKYAPEQYEAIKHKYEKI